MLFEWNASKNAINKQKHGVSFETAKLVFSDPLQLNIQDIFENGEERWQTLGKIGGVVVLLVAHTHQDLEHEIIRIISARKATARERKHYEQGY